MRNGIPSTISQNERQMLRVPCNAAETRKEIFREWTDEGDYHAASVPGQERHYVSRCVVVVPQNKSLKEKKDKQGRNKRLYALTSALFGGRWTIYTVAKLCKFNEKEERQETKFGYIPTFIVSSSAGEIRRSIRMGGRQQISTIAITVSSFEARISLPAHLIFKWGLSSSYCLRTHASQEREN